MVRVNKALESFARNKPERFRAFLYLFVCIIAYGLFIPSLGFYWDDWPTIFYTHSQRFAQLINHFSYDRPFSIWAYLLIGRLGTAPIVWHLSALFIRWAIALALVWALKPLWPKQTKQITFIGLIFAIYPGYYLQPSSVIFAPHLAALALFLVSLGAMGRAVGAKRAAWGYWALSLATALIHMFTVEYYVGLELIRPLYLWLQFANLRPKVKQPLHRVVKAWWPYLALFALWLIWRLFLLKLPSEPYPLVLVSALRSNPLLGLAEFAKIVVQDLVYVLFTAWSELFAINLFSLSSRIDFLAWAIAIAAGVILFYILSAAFRKSESNKSAERARGVFSQQGMLLGLAALVTGMLPVWLIGETIAQSDYNLRYILVAMFGAALFVVSLITLLVSNHKHQIILISVLVGLTIGNHVRATNEYRLDWELQRNFYWQLFWRAPDFEPNTALISFDRLSTYMGDPMTGNALNVLYPPQQDQPEVDIWNFELTRTETINRIQAGELLENDYRGLVFSTSAPDDLVFYYLPPGGCVWILTALDVHSEYLPFEYRQLAAFSNPQNILSQPATADLPDKSIFGGEPQHGWCYYFEKAELARQQANWAEVIRLMSDAETQGLSPNIGIEWLPLVESYANTGDWKAARELSVLIQQMHTRNHTRLCALWSTFDTGQSSAASAAFMEISTIAACDQPSN
ncbi:MAG: hypothetical protein WEC37_00210 [Anaerolineales bacterium]